MRNKLEITQAVLDQLPGHAWTVDDVMPLWWMNIRTNGGLRLTRDGYTILKSLKLESWEVSVEPSKFDRKMILLLDKKLQAPYYSEVNRKSPAMINIIMFSSREAMMATLYGDLKAFLKNLP